MAQWHKIVELHRLLSASRSYRSKKDLTQTLRISSATFDRLVRELRYEFGAPLDYKKNYGGYRYNLKDGESFELPGLWFTTDELKALLCLEALVGSLQEGFLNETFSAFRTRLIKLLNSRSVNLADWSGRFKMVPIAYRPTNPEIFNILSEAVLHRRRVSIEYRKLQDQEYHSRSISPQAIIRYRDNWYVDAWCHKSEGLREFALNRIGSVTTEIESCKEVSLEDLESFFGHSYGIFTGPADNVVEIHFTGIAAREVAQEIWHPKQNGGWIRDDTFCLKVPYGDSRELLMDVLRWGPDAEIIAPIELRNEIEHTIISTAEKYGKFCKNIKN